MKIRNPRNKFDIRIRSSDRVLEIGGGDNPHPRSNVVVDKFTDNNEHRTSNLKLYPNQTFIAADGEELPFKDKEFDYVICCQVLEHTENPARFLSEQFRVAKRGYIDTPSLLGENLFPKASHKWVLHEINDVVYMVEKAKAGFQHRYDFSDLVLLYLPQHSLGFKILERTHPNLLTIRIEWEHDFDYVVDSHDPDVLQYFRGEWKLEWADRFFPARSIGRELADSLYALYDIGKSVVRSKLIKRK